MLCAMNCAVEIPWISPWMLSGKFLAFLAGTGEISTGLEGENGSRNPLWDKGFHHSFSPSSPGSRELTILWSLLTIGECEAFRRVDEICASHPHLGPTTILFRRAPVPVRVKQFLGQYSVPSWCQIRCQTDASSAYSSVSFADIRAMPHRLWNLSSSGD